MKIKPPMTWSALSHWFSWTQVHQIPPPFQFGRTPEIKAKYDASKPGFSPNKFQQMLFTDLGQTTSPPLPHCFRQNDYPYYVKCYINHRILWLNPTVYQFYSQGKLPITMDSRLLAVIQSQVGIHPWVYFPNSQNSSIPQIPHYQVFVLNQTRKAEVDLKYKQRGADEEVY